MFCDGHNHMRGKDTNFIVTSKEKQKIFQNVRPKRDKKKALKVSYL